MKIGIVGLGLIGGSLGLDLKAQGHCVLGVSRRSQTCETAMMRGVVDQADTDLRILTPAEVIFVCTPIGQIQSTVTALIPHLKSTTVVTDVGSVKTAIVADLTTLWPNFVGGHPMAGTADSGIEAAFRGLFEGNPYVLTPIAATAPGAIAVVETVVQALHARLYHCTPEAHDRAVALISHLPVITSASLVATCLQTEDGAVLDLAQKLASSGFRDTSRVGGGNPELGVMMARHNKAEVLRSLARYQVNLAELVRTIEQEDWPQLEAILQQTQRGRPRFVQDPN